MRGVVLLALVMIGCGSSEESKLRGRMLGTWQQTHLGDSPMDDARIGFGGDGTYRFEIEAATPGAPSDVRTGKFRLEKQEGKLVLVSCIEDCVPGGYWSVQVVTLAGDDLALVSPNGGPISRYVRVLDP